MLKTLCFDADDTLWHNERFFRLTQDRFAALLADYGEADHLAERLLAAERRNLGHYGFGVKGFVLSMIETALEVTENRVPGPVIAELIAAGQDMLRHPIELLDHVEETLSALADDHCILLITKGDLLDQERKLAQSGLGDFFDGVEIVADKNAGVYSEILRRRGLRPQETLMTGNSLKSDVLPMVEAGGWGVHVPHHLTWQMEAAEWPESVETARQIASLKNLPEVVQEISHNI